MAFAEQLASASTSVEAAGVGSMTAYQRFKAEAEFAGRFAAHRAEKTQEWQGLIIKAVGIVNDGLSSRSVDIEALVSQAEAVMAPIGQEAKAYTVYCIGHAHIDMNWMWGWPETVSVTHDTFATVDRLMDEFPDFRFSQSQTSVYAIAEDYCPEILEMIKRRIASGQWESTASLWVEGDKNLASGEILCRHLLYTRRFHREKFGLPYEAVKINWEPDTFGHAHTIPAILSRGGVSRYYFCRAGREPKIFWWQAPDGSRILAHEEHIWYNEKIGPQMTRDIFAFEKATGIKHYMFVYGVGDHGGGPTRYDLMKATEMMGWPIWPTVRFATTDDYYSAIEKDGGNIPVIDGELNYVFDGCYTSQSNIKRANRVSENVLPEVEAVALIAGAVAGMPYPSGDLKRGWRHAMLNQFHDILPGSGVHATYEHAQSLFQEIQAISGAIRTRGLRMLAEKVNTAAVAGPVAANDGPGATVGVGLGAGAGDPGIPGGISARNAGALSAEPVLVYNQMPFARSEVVVTKVWNKPLADGRIAVKDDAGNVTAGQVLGRGNYWGHDFVTVAFPAKEVPGIGYRVYGVSESAEAISASGASVHDLGGNLKDPSVMTVDQYPKTSPMVLENELLRVEVEPASGAIVHLIEKASGYDFVPEGGRLGLLELWQEAPHGGTAWVIGQVPEVISFTNKGTLEVTQRGPHRAAVLSRRKYKDSHIAMEIALTAGSPRVDFNVSLDWVERGTRETGVPMLRASFPIRVAEPTATYEIPFGTIERPTNGQEVPALRWADLSGTAEDTGGVRGMTLVNADKYGHSTDGSTLRLTLLRTTYDPDPLPEMGHHEIRFGIVPHAGAVIPAEAMRLGAGFNTQMSAVSADVHEGELPASMGFVEVLTPNVMLASIKKAEDSDALIARLYETDGEATEARVRISRLAKPGASAVETDLMEQPLGEGSARMEDDVLVVDLPAHGIATVRIG